MKVYQPDEIEGRSHSPLSIFGVTPKFRIRCGCCGVDFFARPPLCEDPRVKCDGCGAVNELPLRPTR